MVDATEKGGKNAAAQSSSSAGVATLLEQGRAASRAGRKAEARYYFRRVLASHPGNADALLWMAYLAGGGQASLEYTVRVLESDPHSTRARAAIRWARHRTASPPALPASPRPATLPKKSHYGTFSVIAVVMILLSLGGGFATASLILDAPNVTPTRAVPIAMLPSPTATPTPSDAPSATPTATQTPIPTASPMPSTTPTTAPTPTPTLTQTPAQTGSPTPLPTSHIGDNFRWIDVDLSDQLLIAYEGETPVRTVTVSTGLPRTPTVTGRFQVYVKYRAADMSGPGYFLRSVPYVMYFYQSYGLHGTYWHNNFGHPMSHGCVNLPTPEAEWLFNWASVGTPVVVHD